VRKRSRALGCKFLGYHGPLWTPEDIALLGQVSDAVVARRTRRTLGAVRQKREELGIPNPAGGRRKLPYWARCPTARSRSGWAARCSR
jgi:hypothetical protein